MRSPSLISSHVQTCTTSRFFAIKIKLLCTEPVPQMGDSYKGRSGTDPTRPDEKVTSGLSFFDLEARGCWRLHKITQKCSKVRGCVRFCALHSQGGIMYSWIVSVAPRFLGEVLSRTPEFKFVCRVLQSCRNQSKLWCCHSHVWKSASTTCGLAIIAAHWEFGIRVLQHLLRTVVSTKRRPDTNLNLILIKYY